MLQAQAAAAAAFRSVAHDQVGIDQQARADAVTRPNRAQGRHAILVGLSAARRIDVWGAHDQKAAAVGCDRRIGALVEQDRVVLDIAAVAEPDVRETAAVAGAQVPAYPVGIELVEVGTGADADTACPRRRRREQLVAGGSVNRDVVVVHVHVQVVAVGQLQIRDIAAQAGPGSRVGGAPREVRRRILTLADADAARQRARVVVDTGVGDL